MPAVAGRCGVRVGRMASHVHSIQQPPCAGSSSIAGCFISPSTIAAMTTSLARSPVSSAIPTSASMSSMPTTGRFFLPVARPPQHLTSRESYGIQERWTTSLTATPLCPVRAAQDAPSFLPSLTIRHQTAVDCANHHPTAARTSSSRPEGMIRAVAASISASRCSAQILKPARPVSLFASAATMISDVRFGFAPRMTGSHAAIRPLVAPTQKS
jgi:hypothetical protein